ncbi:hypothetical protein Taro_024166 [Colocasia esculenta]|uniref:GOLD domain-containing protein n=1 Tax=Colocasia esculenta TaxID=4460 RepID=A0A843V8K9_COLES|nr:hypothetical protein [Colocasia esculenta]
MGGATVGGASGRPRANPILPLFAALLLTSTAHAVLFTLGCGGPRAKCITQDLRGPAVSVARYRVADSGGDGVAPQKHKMRVRVRDPKGKSIRQVESVESGEFAFLAKKTGRYSTCFWSLSSASISIDFEWSTGNATHSWHSIARKMQAQMPGAEASKQPLLGPNAPANLGPKAFESTEDKPSTATGAEGEADDDDDNEDGGKGDKD